MDRSTAFYVVARRLIEGVFGSNMLFYNIMSALVLVGLSLVRSISAQSQIIKTPGIANGHWIDTWTSMPQLTEFTNLPPPPYVSVNHGKLINHQSLTVIEWNKCCLSKFYYSTNSAHVYWSRSNKNSCLKCIRIE